MTSHTARAADPADAERSLLILKSDDIVVGLLPNAGGRMVVLRAATGKNWLASDPAEWPIARPVAAVDSAFSYALYGATVWAGPQSAFWADQELDLKRRNEKANWPPDPFFEWGHAVVKNQSATGVELVLPASPVTGLQLTKTYRLTGPGEVTLQIVATNTRTLAVTRDLWPDVSLDPSVTVRVPVKELGDVRIVAQNGLPPSTLLIEKGDVIWPAPSSKPAWMAKAFIAATRQQITCDRPGERLTITGSLATGETVHREQAPVEIYRSAGDQPRLEAEMHSAVKAIQPQEQIEFTAKFTLSK